jgi:hypothetical protein
MKSDIFFDQHSAPTDVDLQRRLGRHHGNIASVLDSLASDHGEMKKEWKFSKQSGWYLVFAKKSRRIFYLFPRDKSFTMKIVLGGKAMASLKKTDLPARVESMLRTAKKYPEGFLCVLEGEEFVTEEALILLRAKLRF